MEDDYQDTSIFHRAMRELYRECGWERDFRKEWARFNGQVGVQHERSAGLVKKSLAMMGDFAGRGNDMFLSYAAMGRRYAEGKELGTDWMRIFIINVCTNIHTHVERMLKIIIDRKAPGTSPEYTFFLGCMQDVYVRLVVSLEKPDSRPDWKHRAVLFMLWARLNYFISNFKGIHISNVVLGTDRVPLIDIIGQIAMFYSDAKQKGFTEDGIRGAVDEITATTDIDVFLPNMGVLAAQVAYDTHRASRISLGLDMQWCNDGWWRHCFGQPKFKHLVISFTLHTLLALANCSMSDIYAEDALAKYVLFKTLHETSLYEEKLAFVREEERDGAKAQLDLLGIEIGVQMALYAEDKKLSLDVIDTIGFRLALCAARMDKVMS